MIQTIGIDISKRDFHVSFSEDGDIYKFNNDTIGINQFIKHLKSNKYEANNTFIGLESTGSYHLPVAYLCTKAGYTINVINPLITKKQNQVSLRRVKTDEKDARLIRHCLINGAGYPFCETRESLAIKTLVRQRSGYSMLRHRTRLKHEEILKRESYLKTSITTLNKELYDFLNQKIKLLDAELRQYNSKTQKLLQTIPGIGPQTAVTFLSEVGDITRFPNSQKLTAWIGLDPRTHQSGTSIKGKG